MNYFERALEVIRKTKSSKDGRYGEFKIEKCEDEVYFVVAKTESESQAKVFREEVFLKAEKELTQRFRKIVASKKGNTKKSQD